MRIAALLIATLFRIVVLATAGFSQNAVAQNAVPQTADKTAHAHGPQSVTVTITLDHNRIVIDLDLALPDGTMHRTHAWVDNGNPELYLSRHLATLLGLSVTCDDHACSSPSPRAIIIGGMSISLASVKEATIPLKPVNAASVMAPGMNAEMNIPSAVLRNFDVLINFPGHELTIAQSGTLKFKGVVARVIVNAENGLIEVPSQIENKKYNLGLDVGSSISFLSGEIVEKLSTVHADWPHMTGAVGPANMWGLDVEPNWKLMRLDRLQYGPLFLTGIPVVSLPQVAASFFEKRAGVATAGLLGTEALLNYRIGLDYAHSTVYFDFGRTSNFPDFDVIGLILRPDDDTGFIILGVADFDAKPSVPGVQAGDHLVAVDGTPVPGSTMGQVWLMLGGLPGQERTLTIERDKKTFTVIAKVQHFLSDATDKDQSRGKSKKK
jgi:hypothetical protein